MVVGGDEFNFTIVKVSKKGQHIKFKNNVSFYTSIIHQSTGPKGSAYPNPSFSNVTPERNWL